jgi:dTDP-4-dehydrorhamnose 3,5-epimerase
MKFHPTPLEGCYLVEPEPVTDERGWFARTWCKNEFSAIGHTGEWVQINHSFTRHAGTLRGLHYQHPPFSEIKLVRCIAGAVFDVVTDLRKGSSTFLQWFGTEISAANKKMIYIPEGFAHGFQAIADDSELIYHHTQFYMPGVEGGIRYNDPLLNIPWPLPVSGISVRDENHPFLEKNYKGI